MEDIRSFLDECTLSGTGANVDAASLFDHFSDWCRRRSKGQPGSLKAFEIAMGYAGHNLTRLDLGARGFRGIYKKAPLDHAENRCRSAHLSSLGLAGLHLEMVSSTVNSLAARSADDQALVGQYVEELENQSHARDAFRAELEHTTGLPADLIARRLSL